MVSLPKLAKADKGARNSRAISSADSDGFWQRPALMNLVADGLFVTGGFLLLWTAAIYLQQLPAFSLRHVVVVSVTPQVSRQQIEYVGMTAITGNFFTVDLAATRAAYQALPWVRKAEVRRIWPDVLELTIEQHQAVAHWPPHEDEPRLVNSFGEVFVASLDAADESIQLPIFDGPEGTAPRLLERFIEFKTGLASIARVPTAVWLSPRDAWRLTLDDGVRLELGRDQVKHPVADRLARFVASYPIARAQLRATPQTPLQVVDMRYPNGFALRAGGKA